MEVLKNQSIFNLMISFGMFASGIGLLFIKGWAWNFAIAINIYLLCKGLLVAVANFLYFKYVGIYGILFIGITLNLLFYVPILYYLFHKKIRRLYPESSISLFIIGFYLMSFSWTNQNDSIPILLEGVLMIIGFAIIGKAGNNLRKTI